MKKFITTLSVVLITLCAVAQSPDIMNYQAVARNSSGQALASQTIRVRLSIVKNAVTQYSETRQVTTNALGLFNVQIGSAGALNTTGSFAGINWQSNAAPGHVLKVELDINNSGNFIDMGSQSLVSVPYAFVSKTAMETMNIAGRPVDQVTSPVVGSRLSWNGTSWTPVKKDTIISVTTSTANYISAAGGSAPWVFSHAPTIITVTGGERILASIGQGLQNNSTSGIGFISYSLCYQSTEAGSPVNSFFGNVYPDGTVRNPGKTHVSSTGVITLPPGQYRIGLGVKNKSAVGLANDLTSNSEANGFIEIRY